MNGRLLLSLVPLGLLVLGGCPLYEEVTVPAARVTTSEGAFVVALDADRAPAAVINFAQYVVEGFYNNTLFHRVVAGTRIEGGLLVEALLPKLGRDPVQNEAGRPLSNLRGTVAMARTSDPDSATSQFYVNVADNLDLDSGGGTAGYAVFGRVVTGMEVVDAIAALPTETRDGMADVPVQDVLLQSVARTDLTVGSTALTAVRVSTSLGDFVIELYPEQRPATVQNFLTYVDDGFYAGTIFHRVIAGFVVQGGGFTPDLVQKETRDPIANEAADSLANVSGTVSMVPDGPASETITSQFVVNLADNTGFDAAGGDSPGYPVFGRVVDGLAVVRQIAALPAATRGVLVNVPIEDVFVTGVRRMALTVGEKEVAGVRVTTSLGTFDIELFGERAPGTAANFLAYVDTGFYEGTVFHRVVADEYAAAGLYTPQLQVRRSTIDSLPNSTDEASLGVRGSAAMAVAATAGAVTPRLVFSASDDPDEGLLVFGQVVEGMEVVDRIASLPTANRDGYADVPRENVLIESVELFDLPTGEMGLSPEAEDYLVRQRYQAALLVRELLAQIGYFLIVPS